ncbi:MAG: hypothetical protein AB1540_07415 [Bdellovibrionota bacterium]
MFRAVFAASVAIPLGLGMIAGKSEADHSGQYSSLELSAHEPGFKVYAAERDSRFIVDACSHRALKNPAEEKSLVHCLFYGDGDEFHQIWDTSLISSKPKIFDKDELEANERIRIRQEKTVSRELHFHYEIDQSLKWWARSGSLKYDALHPEVWQASCCVMENEKCKTTTTTYVEVKNERILNRIRNKARFHALPLIKKPLGLFLNQKTLEWIYVEVTAHPEPKGLPSDYTVYIGSPKMLKKIEVLEASFKSAKILVSGKNTRRVQKELRHMLSTKRGLIAIPAMTETTPARWNGQAVLKPIKLGDEKLALIGIPNSQMMRVNLRSPCEQRGRGLASASRFREIQAKDPSLKKR